MNIEDFDPNEIAQITVQLTVHAEKRALAQTERGNANGIPEILYNELSAKDQKIWDAFILMIKSKTDK